MYHNSGFSMFFGSDAEMYSSAAVDCTLSLGTPSTRATHETPANNKQRPSAFGWSVPPPPTKPHRGGDPLLSRRCANCDTTSTPLWRNGPRGPKSLCNACGIRFKKEERRATAAAGGGAEGQHGSWAQAACYPSTYGSEFRFVEDDGRDSEFMSWRFNVADRPGILHDFTR